MTYEVRAFQSLLNHYLVTLIATRVTIYRSLRELPKESQKRLFGCLQKSHRKYPKMSKSGPKFVIHFRVFFATFRVFSGTSLQTPKRLFLRLFWDFRPGGPGDSCRWSLESQHFNLFRFSSYTLSLRWAFILGSTVPDQLKTAIIKGLEIRSGPQRTKSGP